MARFRRIPLTQGKVALVDESDYRLVSQFKWYAHFHGPTGNWYADAHDAESWKKDPETRRHIRMHRVILGRLADGKFVDHKNGNGLDNRRANIRIADRSQNGLNRKMHRNNTSGYRGVTLSKGRWRARIQNSVIKISLGSFDTKKEAAKAYDAAAKKYFGQFARLNFS